MNEPNSFFLGDKAKQDDAAAQMSAKVNLVYRNISNNRNLLFDSVKMSSIKSDEIAIIAMMLANTNLMNEILENVHDLDSVVKNINSVLSKFFLILNPQIINFNCLSILRILSRKKPLLFRQLFIELFTQLTYMYSGIGTFFQNFTEYFPDIKSLIGPHKDLTGLFIYKCLLIGETSNKISIYIELSNAPSTNVALPAIEGLLSQFESLKLIDVLSRETFRFFYNESFVFDPTHRRYNIGEFVKQSPEIILDAIIPTAISKRLVAVITNSQQLKSLFDELYSNVNSACHSLLLCDLIRFVFTNNTIPDNHTRLNAIQTIISSYEMLGNSADSFDFLLALCLDILTYNRSKEDDRSISVLFEIFSKLPSAKIGPTLTFLENIALTNTVMPECIARSLARFGKHLNFKRLKLPEIPKELQSLDVQSKIDQLVSKMKWQKKAADTLIAQFADMVSPIFANLKFVPPFTMSDDLTAILNAPDPRIIGEVAARNPVVLCYFVYYSPKATELHEAVAKILSVSQPQQLANIFSLLIPIAPSITNALYSVGKKLLQSGVDLSDTIRAVCYHCNLDEIQRICQIPLFVQNSDQAISLLRSSFGWHRTAQASLWMLVSGAFPFSTFRDSICKAIAQCASQMPPSARSQFSRITAASGPSPEAFIAIAAFADGSESLKAEAEKIFMEWVNSRSSVLGKLLPLDKPFADKISKILSGTAREKLTKMPGLPACIIEL